ncbi:MAG TPA: ATP-binding protein [Thermoanaerobaculia bacterium]
MLRSLRFRLLVMVAAVLAIALGVVAFFQTRVVSSEVRALVTAGQRPPDLDEIGLAVAGSRLTRGDWSGATPLLVEAGRRMRRDLLVIDPGGRLVAASSPLDTFEDVVASRDGRRLSGIRRTADGQGRFELQEPYRVALHGPGGEPLGLLFVMPQPFRPQPGAMGEASIGRIRRTLLLAALIAGAAGLLLSIHLARRILKPVEELTAAARRMEAGDLSQRVTVRGEDEIAGLARAFNAMADRRATAERLRRDLVNDVAHELRSPLTNLRGQIEALQDGLAAPTTENLASLDEEARLLERLVDDLQELALAEAGQIELERGPVDLPTEVQRTVQALRPRLDEKDLRVEIDIPDSLPPAYADARRVAQILRNLLGNAATHTPPGGLVRVSSREEAGEIRVTVEDSGPGIPPEHLPFLFERFYRADASRARATGGAGLGLAIVKQLAEAHGGRVWVESEPGRGAAFGFSLPAAGTGRV